MSKILLTGAAGFIGFDFAKMAIEKNLDIVIVDKMTYAANKIAKSFFKENNIPFFIKDINEIDTEFIRKNDIGIIINFAAETHVDNSIKQPDVFIKTNINGTYNLLKLTKENNLRFHQISTDEVYGDLPINKPEMKFSIHSPINPSSPYSSSKASADLLVQAFSRTYGIKATISRCSNNYGPYQNDEKLIPNIIKKISNGEKVSIYGDGKNVRDWIYVRDHNRAVFKIVTEKTTGIFNIGSNNEKNNLEILKIICDSMGVDFDDSFIFVEDRLGHDKRYAINSESMINIGWNPVESFESGIRKTINFYVDK